MSYKEAIELLKELNLFSNEMQSAMMINIKEKGLSWKSCSKDYLLKKLLENIKAENWVNVANYAFMLESNKGKNSSIEGLGELFEVDR